jgi:hypothetical protein
MQLARTMMRISSRSLSWSVALSLFTWSCTEARSRPNAFDAGSADAGSADASADGSTGAPIMRSIAMSAGHVCALRQTGLYCWGANFAGQLGTGDTMDSPDPTPAQAQVASEDALEVAASSGRTCIRRRDGEVACWGGNEQGQIGDGARTNSLAPASPEGIHDARQLAIDEISTCVLRADGSVACWGASPADAPSRGSLVPMAVPELSSVVELRGGVQGTYCARGQAGWVRCWRLQDGVWSAPALVDALSGARTIAVTFQDEVCGIAPSDQILCHNLDSGHDAALSGSQGAVELVSGLLSACARKQSGDWTCWNVLPPMLESTGSPPIEVHSEVPLLEIAIGGLRACALRADHAVVCADADSVTVAPELELVSDLPL